MWGGELRGAEKLLQLLRKWQLKRYLRAMALAAVAVVRMTELHRPLRETLTLLIF